MINALPGRLEKVACGICRQVFVVPFDEDSTDICPDCVGLA